MSYTNPTNVFNFIPQVVLQYEINRFLNAEERANLNAVLEPPERISHRLPKDAAIKHVLCALISVQRRHVLDINHLVEKYPSAEVLELLGRRIDRYVTFLCRPLTTVFYQYLEGAKARAIGELEIFLGHHFAAHHTPRRLQTWRLAIEHIRGIPFIRHVGGK